MTPHMIPSVYASMTPATEISAPTVAAPSFLLQHKSGPTLVSPSFPLLMAPKPSYNPEDVTEDISNVSRRPSKAHKKRERERKKQKGVVTRLTNRRRCARHANAGSLPDPDAESALRQLKKNSSKRRRASDSNRKQKVKRSGKGNSKRVRKRLFTKKQKPKQIRRLLDKLNMQIQEANDEGDITLRINLDKQAEILRKKEVDSAAGHLPLKGRKVAKYFGKALFKGTITELDVDAEGLELYHVVYEDSDSEDLNYREARNAVHLFNMLDDEEKRWAL